MPQNVSDPAQNVIKVRIEGVIAYLTLNRPEQRNAINHDVLHALLKALEGIDRPEVRAIVLSGEGAVFSTGIDFTSLASDTGAHGAADGGSDLVRFRRFVQDSQAAFDALERIEKPVIGALHGYVGGLGLELALACDARIAATGTQLGMRETRIGPMPEEGAATRLTRTVGYAKARELITTARMIDADEAARIGLVNRVVAEGTQVAAAEELAREMARNALLKAAIEEVNRGEYFSAAELFENSAAAADDADKTFAVALNRIATGLHLRFERGGRQAAINLFSQAMLALDQMKPSRDGIDVDTLMNELNAYTQELRATPRDEGEGMKHRARLFLERRRAPKIKHS